MINSRFAINELVRHEVERYRNEHNAEYSELIKKSGMSQPYFSMMINWRTSKRSITEEHAMKILLACDIPMSRAQAMVAAEKCKIVLGELDARGKQQVLKILNT